MWNLTVWVKPDLTYIRETEMSWTERNVGKTRFSRFSPQDFMLLFTQSRLIRTLFILKPVPLCQSTCLSDCLSVTPAGQYLRLHHRHRRRRSPRLWIWQLRQHLWSTQRADRRYPAQRPRPQRQEVSLTLMRPLLRTPAYYWVLMGTIPYWCSIKRVIHSLFLLCSCFFFLLLTI